MNDAQERDLSPREALELLGHRVTVGAPTPVTGPGPGARSHFKGQVTVRVRLDPPVRLYQPTAGETEWSGVEATCLPDEVEARVWRELLWVVDARAALAEHELGLARRRLDVAEERAEEVRGVLARTRRADDG